MIDACLEYGESIGLLAVSDQSDGYWFLAHSFPIDETVADICAAMSRAMRSATGIATATVIATVGWWDRGGVTRHSVRLLSLPPSPSGHPLPAPERSDLDR